VHDRLRGKPEAVLAYGPAPGTMGMKHLVSVILTEVGGAEL
jgi:hypothetical protein